MTEQVSLPERYRRMAEHELFALAHAYDTLTDEAQTALRTEFARRGLQPPLKDDYEPAGTRLVTIRRYRDLSEGIVARSMLESAGIHVELRDENLIRLDWQVSNFIGGLRLQVYAEEVAAATGLLDQAVVDPVPFNASDQHGLDDYEQPHCPHCGSAEITFEGASRTAALPSLLLLAVPLPTGQSTWVCNDCGTRWTDEPDDFLAAFPSDSRSA